jgi:hypothetical protein
MMEVPLIEVPTQLSSRRIRFEASSLATFLLTLLRYALRKDGVQIAVGNAGSFRAMKDYDAGWFRLGDLFGEHPTQNRQMVVPIKGEVLAAAILDTRSRTKPSAAFLHVDAFAEVNGEHKLITVDGEPFDINKTYTVALNQNLLRGLDNIDSLKTFADANIVLPDIESLPTGREIILEYCMQNAWCELLGFRDWAADLIAGRMIAEEFASGLEKAFSALAMESGADVDFDDLAKAMMTKTCVQPCDGLVSNMIKVLDSSGNGRVSKAALRGIAL